MESAFCTQILIVGGGYCERKAFVEDWQTNYSIIRESSIEGALTAHSSPTIKIVG